MTGAFVIFKREFSGFFSSLSALFFLAAFVAFSGFLPLYAGSFYERALADMQPFFRFQPFLLSVFIPAVAANSWVYEEKTGTAELLLTLPLSTADIVAGKFFAYAAVSVCALALTFPMWHTVNSLGAPDNAVIFVSYAATFLVACCFISVALFFSVCAAHPASAFFASLCVCVAATGVDSSVLERVTGTAFEKPTADILNAFNVSTHFTPFTQGLIALKDVLFFIFFILFWLFSSGIVLSGKKADG